MPVIPQVILIGIGTGRCGTVSLRELLARQSRTCVTHELQPLSWTATSTQVFARLRELATRPFTVSGDVCFSYLPHVGELLEDPRVRVVAMRRDREATVRSYEAKVQDRNHWQRHDGTRWRIDAKWDRCYPKYDPALARRDALREYWQEYYATVDQLVAAHAERVRCFDLGALDNRRGVVAILEHCGIQERDRDVAVGIHRNRAVRPTTRRQSTNQEGR